MAYRPSFNLIYWNAVHSVWVVLPGKMCKNEENLSVFTGDYGRIGGNTSRVAMAGLGSIVKLTSQSVHDRIDHVHASFYHNIWPGFFQLL